MIPGSGFTAWLAGRRVVVFGLARSGQAAAALCAAHGARIVGVDEGPESAALLAGDWARTHLETASLEAHDSLLDGAELLVLSPGIPTTHRLVRAAAARGIPVRSEIEVGYLVCPAAVVAVTGSKGKSTTAALTGTLLAAQGKRCEVAGNIGRAYCEVAGELGPGDWVVLEVSSFQLETIDTFHARVAVLLAISPDHLDRYPSFEAYAATKKRIALHQTADDILIVDPRDRWGAELAAVSPARVVGFAAVWQATGVERRGDDIVWRDGRTTETLARVGDVPLLGTHNLRNAMAALAIARTLGPVDERVRTALRHFHGLHYRMQPAGEIAGIRFVNDSKSTTVEAVRAAVEGLGGTLLLALGGRNKGLDFAPLRPHLARVRRVFTFGEAAPEIERALAGAATFERVRDLDHLLARALATGSPGDTLLFSPGCTSFDMFRNAEHRGEEFDAAVRRAGSPTEEAGRA